MPTEISGLTPRAILLIFGGLLLLLNSVLLSQVVGQGLNVHNTGGRFEVQGRQVFQSLTGRELITDDLTLDAFALKPKATRREKKRSPP